VSQWALRPSKTISTEQGETKEEKNKKVKWKSRKVKKKVTVLLYCLTSTLQPV